MYIGNKRLLTIVGFRTIQQSCTCDPIVFSFKALTCLRVHVCTYMYSVLPIVTREMISWNASCFDYSAELPCTVTEKAVLNSVG